MALLFKAIFCFLYLLKLNNQIAFTYESTLAQLHLNFIKSKFKKLQKIQNNINERFIKKIRK